MPGTRAASKGHDPPGAFDTIAFRPFIGGSGGGRVPCTRGSSIPMVVRRICVGPDATEFDRDPAQRAPAPSQRQAGDDVRVPMDAEEHPGPRHHHGDRHGSDTHRPPDRQRSIARQHDRERGERRCGGGGVPAGERRTGWRDDLRDRRAWPFDHGLHEVVQHDHAHGGGQQERHRPWTPGTNREEEPHGAREHQHRRAGAELCEGSEDGDAIAAQGGGPGGDRHVEPRGALVRHREPKGDHDAGTGHRRPDDDLRHRRAHVPMFAAR